MLSLKKLFLVIPFLLSNTDAQTATADLDTLKVVQILFRHGTREPDAEGFGKASGQLKPVGKEETFNLGIFFRQRYNRFIKTAYDDNEISIVSSETDRTIMSSLLVAHGLYQDFNMAAAWTDKKIPFEPIPVRSIPAKYDKYLQILMAYCPRRKELEDQTFDLYYTRFIDENRDLVDYYAKHSGDKSILDISLQSTKRIGPMVVLQEELVMNLSSNLPIVDWARPLMENKVFLSFKVVENRELANTVEKKKFLAGPLLKLFIENMEQPLSSRKKMYLFGGHDRIMMIIMLTLGIYDPHAVNVPPTASSFILELHEDPHDLKPFVQIWYRNDTNSKPYFLEIPNCGNPCYLSTLKEIVKEFIPLDFDSDCLTVDNTYFSIQVNVTLLCSAFIISLLVVIGVIELILRRRRKYTMF